MGVAGFRSSTSLPESFAVGKAVVPGGRAKVAAIGE
jgi:hypothetical protein